MEPSLCLARWAYLKILLVLIGCSTQAYAQRICVNQPEISARYGRSHQDNDSIITVPVVVHLLFRDSAQNISEQRVLDQLESLTSDYRRLHADTAMTPAVFRSVAADLRMEFCLASRDPESNSTSGITRTQTFVDEIGLTDRYFSTFSGGHDAWNTEEYLNIWVCEIELDGLIAGFAESPIDATLDRQGVVIDYRYFGIGPPAIAPFDGGRTLTHEVGHWLGLEHIWGSEPGCDSDDGIGDTPLQLDRYRNCPDFPQLSCGTQDMFMNFMDLTDDGCLNIFTLGQKERARGMLLNLKPNIVQSDRCAETVPNRVSTLEAFEIFPNPVNDFLNLSAPFLLDEDDLRVFDLMGNSVPINWGGEQVILEHLVPGIYLLKITRGGQQYVRKIIKN